jgi:protein-tyrosine phosphatase
MKNFIDLHTHILPGLDDGPAEVGESLRMLEGLEKLGFSTVFVTPHHRLDSWEGLDPGAVEKAAEDLREMSASRGLQLKLHTGMEFDLDETLPDRSRLRPGKNGPLLVDIGFWSVPRELEGILSVLPGDVCLVHPERNDELCRDTERLESLVAGGIKLVGNLGSLSGLYGGRVNRRSSELLEKELYWAFASDLHSHEQLDWISDGIDNLGAMAGPEAVKRLLSDHPLGVVNSMMNS